VLGVESGGWKIELVEVGMVPIEGKYMGPPRTFPETFEAPTNVLVLRGHGRTVLVDAGSGPLISIWPGSTERPVEVEADLLLATHLDWDHCGGFVTGTWPDALEPAWPAKRVLAPAEAVAEARGSRDEENPAPHLVVAALDGLIDEYGDGFEPAPGLRLRRARGHRTGHSVVEVGDSFLYAADAFHHPLHVEHPEWDTEFDADPDLALATRLALFAELADGSAVTAVAHIAGFGRIERAGDGFRWVSL
jgi:glyoxylase-like metal-dependent hydrolase (beta-lactamase superfamily II)